MNFIRILLLTITILLSTIDIIGQAPQGVNYQAVARDIAGAPLINSIVNVQFDIRQSTPTGTTVYSETHVDTTNQFGLFTLEIGGGMPVSGTFAGINWSTGLYYLQVTVNGDAMTPSQLLSVPYALHANTATSGSPGANGHNALADSIAEPPGANCPNGGYLINMGSDDNDDGTLQALEIDISYYICNGLDGAANNNDTSATNELQTISISNDTIFLSNGGFVVLPSGAGDGDWLVNGNDMSTIPSGNVGIGTATPARKLAIESNSTIGDGLLINNSSTGNPGLMFQTQGNSRFVMGVDQSDNDKFKIGTTNIFTNTRFTINQFGNVGIGTTNPLHQLTVGSADTIVANFVGTNPNGSVISVGALSPTAPVGAIFLSGSDSGLVALDPNQKTLFLANTTQNGHVGMYADSSAAMYGLQVANVAGDLIYNQGTRMYNETDTIYSFSSSGTLIHVNQGSFYTDSLYVLGNNANNLNWVLANDGLGQAVWTDPNTLGIGSLWQSNSPDIYFNTGNVGIGTTTPSVSLTIEAGIGDDIFFSGGSNADIRANAQLLLLSNGGMSMNSSLADVRIQTANVDRINILNSGQVGIGTGTPASTLHVNGQFTISDGTFANPSYIFDGSSTGFFRGTTGGERIEFITGGLTSLQVFQNQLRVKRGSAAAPGVVWSDETGTGMYGSGANDISFVNNGTESVRIDGLGNVGIGTGSPLQKLHIQNGTIRIDDGSNPYTFPTADGAANEVLTTDGAGNVTWQVASGGSGNWSLLGNSGTVDGVNFIGTIDAVPLNFRVNNIPAGRIDPTLSNVFFGDNSSPGVSTGGLNTIVGSNAGFNFSTGNTNTLIGSSAGFSNIAGNANTMLGYYAGYATTGSFNTFVGEQSAANNTSGERNVFLGRNSGMGNTIGNNNVFLGYEAGINNINGSSNVGLGYNAGPATGGLTNATAIGSNSVVSISNAIVLGNNTNVGIGTSSPTARLDLNGTFKLTDGTEGTGKILTSDGSGNATWQAPPAPVIFGVNSSVTTIPAGTTTPVIFSNIEYDSGGGYNGGTGMFQAPVAGVYHVDATVTFDASVSSHEIQIQILRNGGTYKTITLYNDPTKTFMTAHISADIFLPINNTVAVGIYQNSGGPIVPTLTTPTSKIYFNGHLVH